MSNFQDVLKKTRRLQEIIEFENNPYRLFEIHKELREISTRWAMAS